jgi:toxin ParE1/3/4
LSRRVWRLPQAEEDLLEIWLHVAKHNIGAADRLLDSIDRKCRMIGAHPEIGPLRTDIGADVRIVTAGNYLVLYRLAEDRIEIVRVVHGARHLRDLI